MPVPMYRDDDLVPLSALQHALYCERQCALIHVERAWAENRHTAAGRIMHGRVHAPGGERRRGVRTEFGVRLVSYTLGVSGVADVVEFHVCGNGEVPFPVEYKRGRAKKNDCDRVQLCAQAMCLEEMLGVRIEAGALFYGESRRRIELAFDDMLRDATREAAARVHGIMASGRTPSPEYGNKCRACSLYALCRPKGSARSVRDYLKSVVEAP